MKKIAILVVDDTRANLDAAEKQFNGKNVILTCCPMYSMAVGLLKTRKFDILLTDLMMPGEKEGVGPTAEIGKDTPYGLILSILAKNTGVPHVAILTDISHHASPIAWAMDSLLGKNSFVSGFNQGNKNWLAAAEGFMSIENAELGEQPKASTKKSFMLIGVNDDYKKRLEESLKADFNVIFVPNESTENAPLTFAEKNPDITLLIGEINGQVKSKDVKDVFEKLLVAKKPEQRVIAAGWMANDNPHYLQLPFTTENLLEKVRA
ncbi:MAG: response regulator [bacterium]